MLTLLAGCSVAISTSPDRYAVDPSAATQLRVKRVALKNAHQTATLGQRQVSGLVRIRQTIDVKALTDTAITMMSRAMEKQGIAVSPEATKTVTLAVTRVDLGDVPIRGAAATVVLEARYPDGTSTARQATAHSAVQYGWAIDAAVRNALNELLGDPRFVAYLNAPEAEAH